MGDSMENSENFESLLASQETPNVVLEAGQKVEGVVIAIAGDDVFIDVGLKQDGVMDKSELPDNIQAGDNISAYVINPSPQGIRLSRSMSGAGIAALEDAMSAGIPVDGRISGVCKGGYNVEVLGKRAFCPGSQIGILNSDNPEELINKQLRFLITRLENNGRNIVVSHRALADRERKENTEKLFASVKPGDIVEGKITRFAPFGAFVEIAPGIEGMIHISELSWSRAETPEEAVSIDDIVSAKLLSLETDDKGRTRIGLSIKQAQVDPWEKVEEKFKPGQIISGKVKRFAPFGAFVEIAPGIEGLIHLSEMAWGKRVNRPEEVLKLGDVAEVAIREIDAEKRKISLSLRDAQGDPWAEAEKNYQQGMLVTGKVESKNPHGLFVNLAPGITGLLPAGVIRNSASAAELNKLGPGDSVELLIQNLDTSSKRISLMPKENKIANQEAEDKAWKEHANEPRDEAFGAMALAFKKAMEKKGKKK